MRAARQSPAPTGFAVGLSATSEASAPSTATEISDAVAGPDSGAMRFVGATGVSADGIALGGAVDRSEGSTDARRGARVRAWSANSSERVASPAEFRRCAKAAALQAATEPERAARGR